MIESLILILLIGLDSKVRNLKYKDNKNFLNRWRVMKKSTLVQDIKNILSKFWLLFLSVLFFNNKFYEDYFNNDTLFPDCKDKKYRNSILGVVILIIPLLNCCDFQKAKIALFLPYIIYIIS